MLFTRVSGLKFVQGKSHLEGQSIHASPSTSGQSAKTTLRAVSSARLRGLRVFSAPPNNFDFAMMAGSPAGSSSVKNRQRLRRGDPVTTSESNATCGPHHLSRLLVLTRSGQGRLGRGRRPLTLPGGMRSL